MTVTIEQMAQTLAVQTVRVELLAQENAQLKAVLQKFQAEQVARTEAANAKALADATGPRLAVMEGGD